MIKEGVMISGRYQIINRIGIGGMADVYKAMDYKLNRYVAMKVLKQEFREDALFVSKFRTEAQSAAGFTHANVVSVYDVGEDRGLYYIVMELVEGITLKDYIKKKGRLTTKEVISIAVQTCAGIEEAHNHNIIHRDIKPQNIMISKEGKVKVTDFGIAKATSSNTISTNAMGSVHYTSPEQARGGFSDAKSDIYSLGITMYEMITGELPFDGDSTVTIALKHLQEDIMPPSEIVPDIPYSLEQIILKCTQKSPDRRYSDVGMLVRDLRHSLSDPEGDFVHIAPIRNVSGTVVITPEEMSRIQSMAGKGGRYDSDYDDDDYEEERPRQRKTTAASGRRDVDPKMVKIMRILTIVVAVIFAFLILFFVGKATGIIKIGPGIDNEKADYRVPEGLLGLTEEEARERCEEAGLKFVVAGTEESEQYEEGLVCRLKTQEGTQLHEGSKVQAYISSGLKGEEIEIPDVRNKSKSEAKQALIDAGFKASNIKFSESEDDEIEANKVIGTTPEAGSKGTEKTEITVIISKGASKVFVPTLVGKTKEEAEEALTEAGLKGNPIEEYSSEETGKVIEQETEPGESVAKGTTITYTVSKGEEPIETVKVPTDLVGQSFSSVKAVLQNMNLKVRDSYQPSTEYNDGYVVYVEGAGETVNIGTTINVVVSTGPGPSGDAGQAGN